MKNRIRLSATEAARDFSRLLDRVSTGVEAVIERHAEPAAFLSPLDSAPRKLSACIGVHVARPSSAPDERFPQDAAMNGCSGIPRGNAGRTPMHATGALPPDAVVYLIGFSTEMATASG